MGHLHEVTESGTAAHYAGLATIFSAGIAARLQGPLLWCVRGRDLKRVSRLDTAFPLPVGRGDVAKG